MGLYSNYITESTLISDIKYLNENIDVVKELLNDSENINEGVNIDSNKIFKKYFKEYKAELKEFKKCFKSKDTDNCFKHLENAKKAIDICRDEVEKLDFTAGDAVIGFLYHMIIPSIMQSVGIFMLDLSNVVEYASSFKDLMKHGFKRFTSTVALGGKCLPHAAFGPIITLILNIAVTLVKGFKRYKKGDTKAEAFNVHRACIMDNLDKFSRVISNYENKLKDFIKDENYLDKMEETEEE